nr:MAG TPA: hypothetical protein [Caudoviricetes sp.]
MLKRHLSIWRCLFVGLLSEPPAKRCGRKKGTPGATTTMTNGDVRRVYIEARCSVTMSLTDHRIIQTNPR